MPNTRILVIAPRFDEASGYSYSWAVDVAEALKRKGYDVVFVGGSTVARKDVEGLLPYCDLFVFYNHGNEDCLWGSETEKVVDKKNDDLLIGKEVYTMACLSAADLGVDAWKKGCKAYWGYKEPFAFTTDALTEFEEFANAGLLKWTEGASWKECLDYAKNLGNQLAVQLSSSGNFMAAAVMSSDVNCLRCYDAEPPSAEDTKCVFRKIALKLLGKRRGWLLTWKHILSVVLFSFGMGVLLHDYAHTMWEVGGYKEILSLQGGYFGAALAFLGFILSMFLWKSKRKA